MPAKYALSAVLFIFPISSALADGIPIEPGEWEVTTTMEMPMLPAPRVQTHTQCIELPGKPGPRVQAVLKPFFLEEAVALCIVSCMANQGDGLEYGDKVQDLP